MGFLSKIESIRAVMLRLNWNTPCLAACDKISKMVSLVSLIRSARWWAWWQHFQRKSHEKGFFLRNFHLSCRKKFILLCGQEFQCQGLPYCAYKSLGRLSIFLVWKTWWQLVLLSQFSQCLCQYVHFLSFFVSWKRKFKIQSRDTLWGGDLGWNLAKHTDITFLSTWSRASLLFRRCHFSFLIFLPKCMENSDITII